MQKLIVVGLMIAAFAAGLLVVPLANIFDHEVQGRELRCTPGRSVCVGAHFNREVSFKLGADVGGFTNLQCGNANSSIEGIMGISEVVEGGCRSPNYMANFSNGRFVTSIWIDRGVVVRIDRSRRDAFDF